MVVLVTVFSIMSVVEFLLIAERCAKKDRQGALLLCVLGMLVFGLISIFGIMSGLSIAFRALPEDIMLDNKISVLEEENEIIEQNISKIIEEYQKNEQYVSNDQITEKNPIILIALFPEIESSNYVQRQLEIYNSNTQKIKELKNKKIEIAKQKWLLYFGG